MLFDFSYDRLANPNILQPYCWLLRFYQENTSKTNHYIVKMLHRIAIDLKMYPMLFQLSLFTVFNKILQDNAVNQYKVQTLRDIRSSKFVDTRFLEE